MPTTGELPLTRSTTAATAVQPAAERWGPARLRGHVPPTKRSPEIRDTPDAPAAGSGEARASVTTAPGGARAPPR